MYFNNKRKKIKKLLSFFFLYKQKEIIQIPSQLRFGNHLYFFLNCYINRKYNNIHQYIMYTDEMKYWLNYFPTLKEFIIYPTQIKKIDNRKWFNSYFQEFNVDFSEDNLYLFIEEYLINNPIFNAKNFDKNLLMINIRRGDFYSNQLHKGFRFDQIDYVSKALSIDLISTIRDTIFISDDINWCKENLKDLLENKSIIENTNSSPINDFISICKSSNLIITNSTFSYWGGYISKYLSKENVVIAPAFGGSAFKDNKAIQLHPEWEIITMD